MRSWRLAVNLLTFLAITVALTVYGVVDLLGNPLRSPTTVSAVFPDASGLYQNFPVELNGVDVGTVSGISLVRTGALVDLSIKPGVRVPADVVASITIANDLGEQVVELTPRHGGRVPDLRSGAVVPVVKNGVPVQVGRVVASATRLLRAIPAGRLNALLADLASALRGQADNLRTIVSAGTSFSRQFLAYQHQYDALFANAPPVMDAVSAVGPQLRQALASTEAVLSVLAQRRGDLTGLLHNGAQATEQLGGLVANQGPDLACLIHDLSRTAANLDQPANLSNLSSSLSLNHYFFGAVNGVAVAGSAKPLVTGQAASSGQIFLRTRLLLPPASPPGISYTTQVGLPAVEPGAGCTTELGKGVGPATQPGFTPAAGGSLRPATAAESKVRGGGRSAAGASAARSTGYRTRSSPGLALLVVGLLAMPGMLLAWGASPSRRRFRRRA